MNENISIENVFKSLKAWNKELKIIDFFRIFSSIADVYKLLIKVILIYFVCLGNHINIC